jgi:fibronectin type 3 domain-containing protein
MRNLTLTLLSILLAILFSGCDKEITTPKYTKPKIDQTLEKLDKKSIRYITDMNSIAFEWKRATSERVDGYIIYRQDTSADAKKLTEAAKIDSIYTSHYLDTKLKPNTKYIYRFATYSKDGRESVATTNIEITTKDRLKPVSYIESISNLPKTAKIIWRPHTSERVKGYKIYKRVSNNGEFKKLRYIDGRLNAEFIDKELEDSKIYSYRVVAVTYDEIDSYPSNIVSSNTKPLPKVIELLSASKKLPKEIVVKWSPTDISDMIEYRVYKSDDVDGYYKLIKKTKTNSIKELIKEDGETFFYKVTVVDKDGLESLKQKAPIMGSTLSAPEKPIISSAAYANSKVVLKWTPIDTRARSYVVVKRIKSGWRVVKKINIKDIKGTQFVDTLVEDGKDYEYSVISVDKNALYSSESAPAIIKIPQKGKK